MCSLLVRQAGTFYMAQKKEKGGVGAAVAIGAGVAALSAAAYLLFGPEGKKHRKDLKSWMVKMKAEVMEKMEKAKELTAPAYEAIVSAVEEKYKAMKNVDPKDLEKEVAELKKNWREMMKLSKGKTIKAKAKPAPKKK
jgi:Tfp pilus assembly protein PilP